MRANNVPHCPNGHEKTFSPPSYAIDLPPEEQVGRGDLRPHDLRHTWVTLAGESLGLWKVQQLVDNSSIDVTEGYFHLSAEDVSEVSLGLTNGGE